MKYRERMLRYHIAFYLPRAEGEFVVAEALDFPGAVTQGFDLSDARLMIASPANGAKVPVPRHGEIDNRLARKIC